MVASSVPKDVRSAWKSSTPLVWARSWIAGWRVIVVWECQLGAGRGTAAQRASRLERFARTLVRKVSA